MKNLTNINTPSNQYFRYKHAIYSRTAHTNKINNYPGSDYNLQTAPELEKEKIILNLHRLFKYCVNPIVEHFGRNNVALTSCYRNKAVNQILKGVENSQHIFGYAADIVLTNGVSTSTLFNWCHFNIPSYHQLIWEYPERGIWTPNSSLEGSSWIHISYIDGDNPKIKSVSSTDPKIHKAYEDNNTFKIDNFTHNILIANEQLLEE